MKLLIIGAQGSGKGTQSKLISEKHHIPHLSTGDLLREAYEKKTKAGIEAHKYIEQGNLAPDEIINEILKQELADKLAFILDGYPRNLKQAENLDKITKIDKVIYLKINDKEAIGRLSSRRMCSKCKIIYGINRVPLEENTCDVCGQALFTREDDTEEKIKTRLKDFKEKTFLILERYKSKVIEIDASKSPEEIFEEIEKKVFGD